MSRRYDSYYIPAAAIVGSGIYKWILVLLFMAKYESKRHTVFYRVSGIALASNIIVNVTVILLYDFEVSPYEGANPGLFSMATFTSTLISSICLYYLIVKRISSFYPLNTNIGFLSLIGAVVGVLLRIANYGIAFYCAIQMITGVSPRLLQCQLFRWLSVALAINRMFESMFYITGSVIFLQHMIKTLNASPWKIFRLIALKYSGVDHLILQGICIYIIFGGFYALLYGTANFTAPVYGILSLI